MPDKPSSGVSVASRLATYLRASPSEPATYSERHDGKLIWLHVPDDMPVGPVQELCQMLTARFEGSSCLLTATDLAGWQDVKEATFSILPSDRTSSIEEFLDHWQPDMLLWADPSFHARVLQNFRARDKPMFLINMPVLDQPRRSLRRLTSINLAQFDKVQVTSAAAATQMAAFGFPVEHTSQVLPISEMAWPKQDNENRRRSIATALGPRPIWCAAYLRMAELSAISTAHHLARKSFPTAALILVPAEGEDIKEIVRILSADGWRVGQDNPDNPADPQSEILVTNGPQELGIWYRLAAVSLMGGSVNGPNSCDPFEAAALGSAVICGPITFPHGGRYHQLAINDALVRVDDPSRLGIELIATLAPDRSAALATAAWAVGSEGVEALNQIVALVEQSVQAEAV